MTDLDAAALLAMLDDLNNAALSGDDFCRPITRSLPVRTWRFHDAQPKEQYL